MKKLIALLIVSGAVSFWGCGSTDAMNDNFGFTIDKTLTVIQAATDAAFATDTLDMWQSGSVFMRNRSSVRSLDIRSVSCMITDVQGTPPATLSGTLSIGDTEGGAPKTIATLDSVSMADMMSGMHRMNMRDEGRRAMMDMMMGSRNTMMMYFNCDSTARDSMHFTMRFNFDMQAQCQKMDMMN